MNLNNMSEQEYISRKLLEYKILAPKIYQKMKFTGDLSIRLAEHFNLLTNDFYIAAYLSNIGLLSLSNILEKDSFLHDKEYEQVKRHPILAAEVLKKMGYKNAANIVYFHHENPKYSGYYKANEYPVESNFINIADTFHGCVTIKDFRPPLTIDEAIDETLKNYKETHFQDNYDLSEIEEILRNFYEECC